jgi:hypothetical protein
MYMFLLNNLFIKFMSYIRDDYFPLKRQGAHTFLLKNFFIKFMSYIRDDYFSLKRQGLE